MNRGSSAINRSLVQILMLTLMVWNGWGAIIGYGSTSSQSNIECFGNFELINGECRPCRPGFVVQNRRCVEIGLGFYGASNSGVSFSPAEQDPNCEKLIRIGAGCLQCNKGYELDLATKKCVVSCVIYSQKLERCIDDLTSAEIQQLTKQKIQPAEEPTMSIITDDDKLHAIYDEESFDLLTFKHRELVFQLSVLQDEKVDSKTEKITEIPAEDNELINNETDVEEDQNETAGQILEEFPHCTDYREAFCYSCEKGYILNILLQKCLEVNLPILPPKKEGRPQFTIEVLPQSADSKPQSSLRVQPSKEEQLIDLKAGGSS